ncbi:MMPL family transporter [Hydrogenophaga sp. 5NK40-0174]|uniref:efflux RND transporter permease subunit n=1 Tax=Hydrogenophaga sp. 5NK40-0174 TaxID=3127649 RepID=UPI00310B2DE0
MIDQLHDFFLRVVRHPWFMRVAQPPIMRWRKAVLIFVLIQMIGGALIAFRLKLDNAPDNYFPVDSPANVLEQSLRKDFPGDEFMIGVFKGDDLYTAPRLKAIEAVAQDMEDHPSVDRTMAVTRVDHIASSFDGFVVEPLVNVKKLRRQSPEDIRERVLADRFVPGWLASKDGKALSIVVRTKDLSESRERREVVDAFKASVKTHGLEPALVGVAGTVPLDSEQLESMVGDSTVFTPIVTGIGLLLLYWVVGKPIPVLIAGAAMGTTVVFCVGLIALIGRPFTLVTAMVPTLISAYTAANLLHLYAALKRMRDAGFHRPKRVVFAMQAVNTPALFNVLTTAAGMLSLTLVPIPPVQFFGVVCAIGVLVIYFVVFYLVPPLLVKFDHGPWGGDSGGFAWTKRLSFAMARFSMRRAGWVVGVLSVLILAGSTLVFKVEAETDLLKFFPPEHRLSVATSEVEKSFAGVTAMEVVVDGAARDTFKKTDILRVIQAVQRDIERMPEVDRTFSVIDLMEEMNWAFNEEDPAFRALPDNDRMLAQLLLIYDGDDLEELVDPDYQRMRIQLNMNVHGANAIEAVMNKIQARIDLAQTPGLTWQMAGFGRMFADQEDLLVQGQVRSFTGAFLQIFLIMLLLWRTFPAAVISMLPNLAPLLFVFMLMGGAGIHLDMATVLIAGVVLGITVDDTIHLFHQYQLRREKGLGVVFSIARSIDVAGKAVLATSVLLVAQFMLLTASNFVPSVHFGLLTATGLIAGQVLELVLLPALLVLWGRMQFRQKWLRV